MTTEERNKVYRPLGEYEIGKEYTIDADFANSGTVKLVSIYGRYFCRVECTETSSQWDTMLCRLSDVLRLEKKGERG